MALQIDSKNKHVHVLEFDNWKIREVCEGPHTLLSNLKIHYREVCEGPHTLLINVKIHLREVCKAPPTLLYNVKIH